MAYSEELAGRVRKVLEQYDLVEEKKMFGGLCFMVARHMCCGITDELLMVRVGKDKSEQLLKRPYVREMDFTGKPLKGMLYVESGGIMNETDLNSWIDLSISFTRSLPPK